MCVDVERGGTLASLVRRILYTVSDPDSAIELVPVRPEDSLARLAGDSFDMMIVDPALDAASIVAATRSAGHVLPVLSPTADRFRSLFEHSPICLWEEDGSELKLGLDKLRDGGVTDVRAYLRDNPDETIRLMSLVKVTDVNQKAVRHYEAPDKAALLTGVGRTLTPESLEVIADLLASLFAGNTIFEAETTDRSFSGRRNHVLMRTIVAPGSEKSLSQVYVAMVDITERKELEEQLRQAQKMDAVGHLAGGIAHDFNNLLTVIYANTALLQRQQPSESLDSIAKASERAALLVRQLLAFSRRQVLQMREIELNVTVGHLMKILEPLVREDIHIQLHLADTPVWTYADTSMFDQVVMNLVVNARDAMPNGGTLTLSTSVMWMDDDDLRAMPDLAPGAYARLHVRDTGTGIAPENLKHIFDPFFTTKEVGKGTGLGLATVFGIVKQHEGAVAVTSELGAGTTFSVILPAARETARMPPPDAIVLDEPEGRGESILVVEDEEPVRRLIKQVLEMHGYRVQVVSSGAEALTVDTDDIDLVLTDIVMPGGVSGGELSKRLSTIKPTLRFVFMSGYAGESAGSGLELRVGENFLAKPFSPAPLLACLRACLDAKLNEVVATLTP